MPVPATGVWPGAAWPMRWSSPPNRWRSPCPIPPARRRLLIADLHLGKGNVLRAAGIPVPSGGTGHDLARLGTLLETTGAGQLWVLGDFLHGPRQPRVEALWRAFLAAHPECSCSVIAGNHDRALVPDAAGVVHLPDDVSDGPFRFRHMPLEATDPDGAHVICGHVHPVVRLPGLPGRYPALALEHPAGVLGLHWRLVAGGRPQLDRLCPWRAGGAGPGSAERACRRCLTPAAGRPVRRSRALPRAGDWPTMQSPRR